MRSVSTGWTATEAVQAARPPHTRCTKGSRALKEVKLCISSVRPSKVMNLQKQKHAGQEADPNDSHRFPLLSHLTNSSTPPRLLPPSTSFKNPPQLAMQKSLSSPGNAWDTLVSNTSANPCIWNREKLILRLCGSRRVFAMSLIRFPLPFQPPLLKLLLMLTNKP